MIGKYRGSPGVTLDRAEILKERDSEFFGDLRLIRRVPLTRLSGFTSFEKDVKEIPRYSSRDPKEIQSFGECSESS